MWLSKITLYQTKTRFYFVGTDACEKEYRVLKIDRTVYKHLAITEDSMVYTKAQMQDLIKMIDDGNKSSGGLKKITPLYGIVGFVHFLEGFYVYIITKASVVAIIGGHYINKVDETQMVSIPLAGKIDKHPDESRYMDVFSNVDLSRNFYFSYTYDLTRSLQSNILKKDGRLQTMFIWNFYLLRTGFQSVSKENKWSLPLIHGFLSQNKLSVAGRTVFITLLGRRSRYFAGVRFLKRGVNDQGYVANDVETEQIVNDASFAHNDSRRISYTSYVQHRGSIPLFWSQENTNMAPKPPIQINLRDPFNTATALHFENLFERYSTPVIVLNLVKQKESTKRESILLEEYQSAINYLNQFLPDHRKINYVAFDMSRASKSPDHDVIGTLEKISEETLKKTNFFHSSAEPYIHFLDKEIYRDKPLLQSGIVRTNCIDCLDRTNAAQFILGKCALAHQLYSLGLLESPTLCLDCGATKLLMQMYHDHGDIIALQYGGSALVNTMESYRKTNIWSSQSRDMIETIKRYYSNSFTDAEKQDAINLFLGNFVSHEDMPTLWELSTDYYLHHDDPREKRPKKNYREWYDPKLFQVNNLNDISALNNKTVQTSFDEYYDTANYTSFNEHFLLAVEEEKDHTELDPFYSPFKAFSSSDSETRIHHEPIPNNNSSFGQGHVPRIKSQTYSENLLTNSARRSDIQSTLFGQIPTASSSNLDRTSWRTSMLNHSIGSNTILKTKHITSTAALAKRLLEPSISQEEMLEYERYVNQFKDASIADDLNQYNKAFYEEYIHNYKTQTFIHDPKDLQIYEKHVNLKNTMNAFDKGSVKVQEAYKRWLDTERLGFN